MKNKKGQISKIGGIVTVLVLIGIMLGTLFLVTNEFADQLDNNIVSINDEAGAFGNTSTYNLSRSGTPGFNSPTLVAAKNATSGTAITITDIQVSAIGIVTNATLVEWNNLSINYTYNAGNDAYESMLSVDTALLTIPDLLGLIVLIAMVGIILLIVFNVIPGGTRMNGA